MKKSVLTFCAIVGLGLQAMAQGSTFWTPQATGFATPSRGIRDISAPSATVAWAITYDGSGAKTNTQDFTHTSNGGTTWTAGTIPNIGTYEFSNISAVDANNAWVAMFNNPNPATGAGSGGGRIYRTSDGGATWTQQAATRFTNANSFLNIVHMFDLNKGWAQGDPISGEFEMYTTTDGGTTWTPVPGANIPNPLSGEYGLVDLYATVGNNTIFFGTNKGRVFKSTDGGLNWTASNTGLTDIHEIAFANANEGLVRKDTDLYRTKDGGTTWAAVAYSGSGSLYLSDMKYVPGTTATYVSTGAGDSQLGLSGSSYSIDGGTTWVDYDNGFQRTALAFFSPTVGYAGGFNTDATTNGIFKFTGTVISGISNKEFSKNIKVFPNPSNGLVNVELSKVNGGEVSINVTDALGRSVFAKEVAVKGAYSTQLDLSNLKAGVYMLQVKTGENLSTRKLVIE